MKILTILICVYVTEGKLKHVDKRIVKGKHVYNSDKYPSIASLQVQYDLDSPWEHKCGAVLIGQSKLLTAAHCLVNTLFLKKRVILGVLNIQPDLHAYDQVHEVSRFKIHHDYEEASSRTYIHDIAILYLNTRVKFTKKVKPALLAPKGKYLEDTKCAVAGWGTGSSFSDFSNQLREATVTVISNEFCKTFYRRLYILPTNMCLFNNFDDDNDRPGTCDGDDGGPAMCGKNFQLLAGITSWGKECDSLPNVYVRVSEYYDWIQAN
ncbi:unnamed protein product [Lymnaea stagnalis]|uniref:Peptidase S1 domain-containing protein n=1 Tax=Lymnaea stagnalis TaxID=6523 RepID=A0AAV2HYR2_LYMST